ncbi:hypothetical protein [Spiroplasma ixodetis]|uniref:hypothetical protein n=1 Tax=Spiroplasma ixodetis TaxID=2141 RepID=UPI0025767DAA|nr:hypothetical protein [Spiroplasma ixodetis]WJG69913.1 hypothetical protein SIXOD_v1c09010 [Spiroplasma ixodetis Y32]
MKLKTLKKLQLITVLLFILTILITVIGLFLINYSNYSDYHVFNPVKEEYVCINVNGFEFLNHCNIDYILSHSANYICWLIKNNENYYNWIQLQIGVIFCIILIPILMSITMSFIFLIIGLKIKIKNNNFWDAIANCEIINNYYIH